MKILRIRCPPTTPPNCAAGHLSENYNPRLKRKGGGGIFTKLIKKRADFGNASWGLGSSERRLWLFGNRSGGFPAGTQPVPVEPRDAHLTLEF